MQKLSLDIETKVLNDLDDKLHGIAEVEILMMSKANCILWLAG
jgi:hypothetical protein